MAVEARHMNLLPSQFITNRDFMKSNQGNVDICNTQMSTGLPYAAKVPETVFPYYQSSACDWGSGKSSMNKADSGLTCNFTAAPRKRTRHSVYDELNVFTLPPQKNKFSGLLDQELVSQIQQQQSEIDRFIALHTEKMRLELEERKKRQSRMLVSAIEERVVKKLKEKDEEIERMGKLNWVLQERVRSLCMENQLWKELAQTNEATVNSLRTNLERVLAHVSDDGHTAAGAAATQAEDAESSCGSSDHGREVVNNRASRGGSAVAGEGGCGGEKEPRRCRKCGVGESGVLLLPCRHLCLCTICGSTLHTCPVCNSAINASVHVNFS